MSTPANSPACPPSVGFDGKKMAINIAWICLAVLAIAVTSMLILGMIGCTSSSRSSFTPSQGWSNLAGGGFQQSNPRPAASQQPVQMPSNFAEVSKGTAPHVEKVFSSVRDSWPAAAKAQYAQGFNPVGGRIPGTTKAWFYHDTQSEIWNPHPDFPASLLPAAREAHVGGSR